MRRCIVQLGVLWGSLTLAAASAPPAKLFLEPAPGPQVWAPLPPGPPARRVTAGRLAPDLGAWFEVAADRLPANVLLNLFPDYTVPGVIESIEQPAADQAICHGRIEGVPGSHFILTRHHSVIAGSVLVPGRGSFQIQHAGGGVHRISELDPVRAAVCTAIPRKGDLTLTSLASRAAAGAPQTASEPCANAPDSGNGWTNQVGILDVLVLYSEAAAAGAGGDDGIRAAIAAGIAEANLALGNSRVNLRLRLVHTEAVDYPESGALSTDLERVETGEDGYLADVAELRDQYRADLVCLVTEQSDDAQRGLANIMAPVSPAFARDAFSVVQRAFLNGSYTLAHEFGHNLGCQHDRAFAAGPGAECFSYGYRFVGPDGLVYHDVMAEQTGGGIVIPYFSNPEVTFLGVPTGVPDGATNSADNARTINLSAQTAIAFRAPATTVVPPRVTLLDPADGDIYQVGTALQCDASVSDASGRIVKVEFLVGDYLIGVATNAPYSIGWTRNVAGKYSMTVRATDDFGVTSASAPVSVRLTALRASATDSFRRPDGAFQLRVAGQGSEPFQIDASENAVSWMPVLTNGLTAGGFDFVDEGASKALQRFYRVRPAP